MDNEERPRIGPAAQIGRGEAAERLDELGEGERFPRRQWDSPDEAEDICDEILGHDPSLEERELWRELAAYRRPAVVPWTSPPSAQIILADQQKLRQRVRLLIGRLPQEGLEDFYGLVTFTQTFLARVESVCDLLVYLYAEREKGLEPEETEPRLYIHFFAQKLMGELDELMRISERYPLSALADEYLDWLTDRILDGEVLL